LGFSARTIYANCAGAFRKELRFIYAIRPIGSTSNWRLTDYSVGASAGFHSQWNGLLNDRNLVRGSDFRIIRVELSGIGPWLATVSSGVTVTRPLKYQKRSAFFLFRQEDITRRGAYEGGRGARLHLVERAMRYEAI
jgi:hypothetical protein